jgi:hypothetical protein
MFLRSMSKNNIKTGVTWTLACSLLFEIIFRVVVVSSGVARITFHVYVD